MFSINMKTMVIVGLIQVPAVSSDTGAKHNTPVLYISRNLRYVYVSSIGRNLREAVH